jgi:hypothetical protein
MHHLPPRQIKGGEKKSANFREGTSAAAKCPTVVLKVQGHDDAQEPSGTEIRTSLLLPAGAPLQKGFPRRDSNPGLPGESGLS